MFTKLIPQLPKDIEGDIPYKTIHERRLDVMRFIIYTVQGAKRMAKGKVSFEQDLCKGCALCVAACPLKIVELDKAMINKKGYNPATVYKWKMHRCAKCATMCPDSVITVERD